MSIRIYCEVCDELRPMVINMGKDVTYPEQGIWGDILCKECNFVIATIQGEEEGSYEITKITNPITDQ